MTFNQLPVKAAAYLSLRGGLPIDDATTVAFGIIYGIRLALAHPEWCAAYLRDVEPALLKELTEDADDLVHACPVELQEALPDD